MKISALLLFCCLLPHVAAKEPTEQERASMSKFLASDIETAISICGGASCSGQDIESLVEYKCDRAGANVDVCILEPIRKSKNMYIGVFARNGNSTYMSQFIFFGSGIGLTNTNHQGVRDLVGREIEEDGEVSDYKFCWDKERYASSCHGQ